MNADQYWEQVLELIRQHGHMVQAVFADVPREQPGFAYTIGLSRAAGFEVIVFGLNPNRAHAILNSVASTVEGGRAIPLDVELPPRSKAEGDDAINDWVTAPVMFRDCVSSRAARYTTGAFRFGATRILQMVLPDTEGRFPEDPDYEHRMLRIQPTLYDTTGRTS